MKKYEKNASPPVVIISAARSGTKLLRRIMSVSNEFGGCPYDANYVWKIGNLNSDHDELSPEDLSDNQVRYIRRFFEEARARDNASKIIEKTVSNSLRIPVVRKVFPSCKIIHLYRDGHAVASSTKRCWKAPPTSSELQTRAELARKLRDFPYFHGWPYLARYLKGYAKKYVLRSEQAGSWGVRYKGIDLDLQEYGVRYVATKQWFKCVQHSCEELGRLRPGVDYINVSFEDLVLEPEAELGRILEFVSAEERESVLSFGRSIIDPSKSKVPSEADANNPMPEINQMVRNGQKAIETLING